MRDAARAADTAEKLHWLHLTRAYSPSQNRKGRPHHQAPPSGNQQTNSGEHRTAEAAAARAVAFARRRTEALKRTAITLDAIGRRDAALRVAALAAGLAEVVL